MRITFICSMIMVVSLAVLNIGCDDDDDGGKKADNVAACNDWLESMECGSFDFTTVYNCSDFDTYPCDISDYFTCLKDSMQCDDTTGIPTFDAAGCAEKAQCN